MTAPSRKSRPLTPSGLISKGRTMSSGVAADTPRLAWILFMSHRLPSGNGRTPGTDLDRSAEAPGEDALLGMQAIFGLFEHHGPRTVDDLGRHLLSAVRRQAMHE